MDFEPNDDQRAVLEAVAGLLEKHAGPARAIELEPKGSVDGELDAALAEAGFLEMFLGDETGPLEAALLVEAVAKAGGVVSIGAQALVAPAVLARALPGPVALARADDTGPVRFAAQARALLFDCGDEARLVTLERGDAEPVVSKFMLPMGRLRVGTSRGEPLGAGSGEKLRSWWRVALATEAVGVMRACLDVTIEYVKRRRQFGRPIGSFQGVQHRLAECAVLVEGARWLAYEAAASGAPPEAAALAAAHATSAASRVFVDTHQFSGAMGFTREHDLHVFSMRLQALRLELGGTSAHRKAVAASRWGSPS